MKFENEKVFNFDGALRGMRNPLASWEKSDSYWGCFNGSDHINDVTFCNQCFYKDVECNTTPLYFIGENDMNLAKKLISGGSEHRKFLRQIFVSVDITAPLYWWKEFDTYKVGTVANSTSTMHKLASNPITVDCFEIDDFEDFDVVLKETKEESTFYKASIEPTIFTLENLRQRYLNTKDKRYWKELVRWLPESWLQTRTITMNYENLRTIYHQRKDHKLNEWSGKDDDTKPNFIAWIKTLPYAQEFIID